MEVTDDGDGELLFHPPQLSSDEGASPTSNAPPQPLLTISEVITRIVHGSAFAEDGCAEGGSPSVEGADPLESHTPLTVARAQDGDGGGAGGLEEPSVELALKFQQAMDEAAIVV